MVTCLLLVAGQLLDMRILQALAVSLAAMAVVSVALFRFAVRGGIRVSMEGEGARIFKGEECEASMRVESRATGWIGSVPTSFKIGTAQLLKAEPAQDGGRVRLLFLGRYAGRAEGLDVGISITDPLQILKRSDRVVCGGFRLDTLPLCLAAPLPRRRLTIFGLGDKPTGYPGQGQELYGLDEYRTDAETRDIVWKRVANSPDEALVARVREGNMKESLRVGVVSFAERGDQAPAWTDMLCEALGKVGMEALSLGAGLTLRYPKAGGEGATEALATDVRELADAVMACSAAPPSRDVEGVVAGSDVVVTGLRELHDPEAAALARSTLLLVNEAGPPPPRFADDSVVWTGRESLLMLVARALER